MSTWKDTLHHILMQIREAMLGSNNVSKTLGRTESEHGQHQTPARMYSGRAFIHEVERANSTATLEDGWPDSHKIKHCLPQYNPATVLLSMYLEELKTSSTSKLAHEYLFKVVLFITNKTWKQSLFLLWASIHSHCGIYRQWDMTQHWKGRSYETIGLTFLWLTKNLRESTQRSKISCSSVWGYTVCSIQEGMLADGKSLRQQELAHFWTDQEMEKMGIPALSWISQFPYLSHLAPVHGMPALIFRAGLLPSVNTVWKHPFSHTQQGDSLRT